MLKCWPHKIALGERNEIALPGSGSCSAPSGGTSFDWVFTTGFCDVPPHAADGLLKEAIRSFGYKNIDLSGRPEPFSRRDAQEGRD
jgi:hypothetical protein